MKMIAIKIDSMVINQKIFLSLIFLLASSTVICQSFKLPWNSGTSYYVSRTGIPAPSGGNGSTCFMNYGFNAHDYVAIDFDSPNGVYDPVRAVAAGTVIFAGISGSLTSGYGRLVKIRHSDGTITYYAHNEEIYVKVNDVVQQGCIIADGGTTGSSSGDHIHFEWRDVGDVAFSDKRYPSFIECSCIPKANYCYTSTNANGSCGVTCTPPLNDNCSSSSALSLTSSTSCSSTSATVECATSSGLGANNPVTTCGGCTGCSTSCGTNSNSASQSDCDVFFRFQAVSSTHTVTVSGINFDAVLELRSGCGSGCSNYIGSTDPSGSPSTLCLTYNNLTPGTWYYIRVYRWSSSSGCSDPSNPNFNICVTHTGSTSCSAPTNTSQSNITQTSSTLSWGSVSTAVSYTLQYRVNDTSTWTTVNNISNTSYSLSGLSCNTSYEWRVLANCSSGSSSSYSTIRTFTTSSCPSTCTDQFESNNSTSTATLVFANPLATNSSNYTLQGNMGFAGDQDWFRVNIQGCGTLTVNLSNLPLNYDLELWNASATVALSGSYNTGNSNEQVTFTSTSSSLSNVYLKVYANNSSNFTTASCYNLQFVWSPSTCPCSVPSQPGNISGPTTVCQNGLHAYSINPVSGATSYTWSLPATWSGNGSNTTSINTSVGSSGGTISVTANNSCGSSSPRNLSVSVNQIPAQPASISGATSVCQGSSQTYSVPAISGATSYTWSLPSGWSGSSNTNLITANVGSTGGTISVIANNSCGSGSSRTLSVSVNQIPTVSVNPSNVSICSGGSGVVLQASGTAQNYSWSPSTGLNTTTGQTVTANPGSTTTYTVTGSNGNCSATATSTVTISSQLSASISPSNPELCENGSITLTASQGTAYSWTGPNGFSANSRVINVSNTGLYSVTVTNPGGCNGNASANVTVTTAPVLNVNAGADMSIQSGDNTTLGGSPSASGGTPPFTYAWSPTQSLNNPNVANPVANPANTTIYTLTVTDARSCSKSDNVLVTVASACQYTLETLIKNVPANSGTHTIVLNTISGCGWLVEEGCSWLDFVNTSGTGSVTLTFNVSANDQATPRTCFVNIQGNLLQVVQAGACLSPQADFSVSQQAGFAPLTVSFYDNSSNSPNEWLWSFQGGSPAFSSERNPIVTYTDGGIFDVTLLAKNNCGESSVTKSRFMNVIVTTGVFDDQDNGALFIYPNPNNGTFNILADVNSVDKAYLNLIATNGQFVYSEVLLPFNNKVQKEILVKDLAAGLYIVQLILNNDIYYSKMVVDK